MVKTKYLDQGYVEEIENYIYNDIPILKHPYYKDAGKNLNEQYIKSILKPGEKYVYLRDNADHMVVTSMGRIINSKTCKQLILRLYKETVRMFVNMQQIKLDDIFEEQGWEYNFQKIFKSYSKYGWKYSNIHSQYKKLR